MTTNRTRSTKAAKPAEIRTIVTFGADLAESGIRPAGTGPIRTYPAELVMADKIRMLHNSTEIAVKVTFPREGDIVAELDKEDNPAQTYTVRRRGTTMTSTRTGRTYAVPVDKLTKVTERIWTYPTATFTGKLYQIKP